MLFRVSSLRGIVLLEFVLERRMFCEQSRCNIMMHGNTVWVNIHVCKVKGCQYMNLYDI